MRLQTKILAGYLVLVAVICSMAAILVHERGRMHEIETETGEQGKRLLSDDGHEIQPHITFHFQQLALFLRISSVCGRVCVSLFAWKNLNLTYWDVVLLCLRCGILQLHRY